MDLMSIGDFARRSRLSANALRLYDELGLLPPARVDAGSGYRYYAAAQLERARLVAALRQLQVPLPASRPFSAWSRRPRRSVSASTGLLPRPSIQPGAT